METTKKRKSAKESKDPWGRLLEQLEEGGLSTFPSVSYVIPAYNCSESIAFTLESILEQNYPEKEIIVVDASSKDRTLEVVKSFHSEFVRIYSVSDFNRYEMMNRGISLASGEYITFLFPGDFYISVDATKHMMRLVVEEEHPDFVYSGSLIREEDHDPRVLLRPFSRKFLREGKQPTSLQSCWFRVETLAKLGKFNVDYTIRGGFDLLCRIHQQKGLRFAVSHRILTDYERRKRSYLSLMQHSRETFRVIFRYFGLATVVWWWMFQNHWRFVKWWLKSLKAIFIGK